MFIPFIFVYAASDSDGISLDSVPRPSSRSMLERSPEFEHSDNESYVNSTFRNTTPEHEQVVTKRKSSSKKKKYLPDFLQKNKTKTKSS